MSGVIKLNNVNMKIMLVLAIVVLSSNFAFANDAPMLDLIGGKQTDEGQLLSFTITATDPDNDTITFAKNDSRGILNLSTGAFSWTPDFNEAGIYFFQFTASDSSLENSEIIMINVTEVGNHAPVLDLIGGKQIDEGLALEFTVTASDLDHDSLVFTKNDSRGTLNANTGYYNWQPQFTDSGIYFVQFTVSDGSENSSEIIMVNITETGNHAPVLDLIGGKQILEGQLLEFTVTASDPDGDSITFSKNDTRGTLNSSSGYYAWLPGFTESGIYFVEFSVSDGLVSAVEIIMVNITEAGNHAPLLNSIGGKQAEETMLLEFNISGSDVDGDTLSFSTNFTFGLLDAATGHFSWTPSSSASGFYAVEFIVSDGSTSSSETIMINVTDKPVQESTQSQDTQLQAPSSSSNGRTIPLFWPKNQQQNIESNEGNTAEEDVIQASNQSAPKTNNLNLAPKTKDTVSTNKITGAVASSPSLEASVLMITSVLILVGIAGRYYLYSNTENRNIIKGLRKKFL